MLFILFVWILTYLSLQIINIIQSNKEIDYSNQKKIEVNLTIFGFYPGKIKIQKRKKYDLIINNYSIYACREVTIPELELKTSLSKTDKSIDLFIDSSGFYTLQCQNQTSNKLEIKVI